MSARDEVLSGGQALDTLLRTLPDKMQKNVTRAGLRAGAAVFLAEVKQNVPVASGALRSTARITGRAGPQGVTVSVKVGGKYKGVDAWYAHLVEFGTRPHVIKPRQQGGALQFGGVTTKSVQHPGTAGRPFVRPAVDSKFPEAMAAVTAKIRQRLTAQGLNAPDPAANDVVPE